jgi:hypothetical protein
MRAVSRKEVDDGIWLASFRYDLSPMCPGWTRGFLVSAEGLEPSTP